LAGRKRIVEIFTVTEMLVYVGRGYYKEHIIPIFRIVAPSAIFMFLFTCP